MPLAEFLNDPKPPVNAKPDAKPADPASKLRKQVFLEFGAIVFLGLLLAGWYVGFRIVAAPRAPLPASRVTVVPATPPRRMPAAAVAVNAPSSPPAGMAAAKIPAPAPAPTVPVVKPVAKTEAPATHAKAEPKPTPAPVAHSSPAKAALDLREIVATVKTSQPGKRKDSESPVFKRREANPHTGERYLQIAAFGPRALDGFLKTLEGQGLHPLVAPGPADNIYRILIGPFSNSAALEDARHLIQASGIEPILRSY